MDKQLMIFRFPKISLFVLLFGGFISFGPLDLLAQSSYSIVEHKIQLFGTSNVHDWILNVESTKGSGNFHIESNQLKKINHFKFEIPVLKIKSERKSKTMDEKVYSALKSQSAPLIQFELKEIKNMIPSNQDQILTATGMLTIAGVSRTEDLVILTQNNSNGQITFSGKKKVYMRDYQIEPPKALLNALTTGNEVVVDFKIVMSKSN
ncbi:MAG: YceI family protein [Saprospiraceae bacterium]|nr:YceI family protein [Saprospiraceae bacterium]